MNIAHPKKKPRVEMKALFWDKIQDNKIKDSVWEKVKIKNIIFK